MHEPDAPLPSEFDRRHRALIWLVGGPAETMFAAADAAAAALTGRAYSTILRIEPDFLSRRLFTSVPETYPTGATKVLTPSTWRDQVLDRSELFMAASPEDMAAAFPDPDVVASLGGRCLVNCPIPDSDGRTIGLFNIAGRETFSRAHLAMLTLIAHTLGPAILAGDGR